MKMFTTIAVATALLGLAACSEPAAETAAPAEPAAETAAPAENTTVETDPAVVQPVDGESVQPK